MMHSMPLRRPGPRAIIADDLTGAMDTGVHFLADGSRLSLRIQSGTPLHLTSSAVDDVLVLDTESRALGPREAYDRIRAVTSELVAEGYLPFYKKIDSTYRGNVGAEIDAMLDLLEYPAAAVISAVPKADRTVRNGQCLVRGIPLHESESGADRLSPHVTSSTQEIVASQSERKSVVIDRNLTLRHPAELAAELARHIKKGAKILLFDTASDHDIRRIVKALHLVPKPLLLVGAAGLADALVGPGSPARSDDGSPGGAGQSSGAGHFLGSGPGLFVSGSLMRTTAEQADRLAGHTDRVGSITLSPNSVVSDPANEMNRIVEHAVALAQSGRHVLLRTSDTSDELSETHSVAGDIARLVGRCARQMVESCSIDTLVLSGGSTAVAVIEALGVTDLRIIGEAESGLPVCNAGIPGSERYYRIVTKAGGFGRVDSYERIMQMMDRAAARRSTAQ